MFSGSSAITMDAKGRLAVPSKLRDELDALCQGQIVVTAHTEERCLLVFPKPQWDELRPQLENMPTMSHAGRRVQRLMLGYATHLELDGSGRILLPPTVRNYANLDKKLILLGQGMKFELWAEESWFGWLDEPVADEEVPDEVRNLKF